MKVFILGVGKSGTTALCYKIAEGLPSCRAFSGGHPGKYLGDYENAVYKHTFEERKGKGFAAYREHLAQEHYDKKIWIARDPRDSAVSRMLFRWHKGTQGRRKQFEAHLKLVLQKERDPRSVPFYEICRLAGTAGPIDARAVFEEEKDRCDQMAAFVRELDDSWYFYRFEDMVDGKYDGLNAYLGFAVRGDTEVPESTGKAKVIRKKAYGDWRHWFTPEDVEFYKPAHVPYLAAAGYDVDDWRLAEVPVIEPEYSSQYMLKLLERRRADSLRWLMDFWRGHLRRSA
jgi:hypothetical protein